MNSFETQHRAVSQKLKQTETETNMVLIDKFLPIRRQKCSKCVSISPLSFLSRLKFIR